MNLFLVRHAESIWNKEQRIQGRKDPGLDDVGICQAKALAKRLKEEHIEVIYSSGLRRCSQTARIISKETKAPIKFLTGIEEIILGKWQGKTVEEVRKEYPKAYKKWLDAPSKARIPGWEGIPKFMRRVDRTFEFILNSDSATSICVVTHWGVIAAYFSKLLNTSFDWLFKRVRVDNCGISKVCYKDGKAIIQHINDTRHLKEKR